MEEKSKFDFEAFKKDAIEKLKEGKKINGSDGVFQPLLKHFLEAAMEAEIEVHLNRDERESGNRKNGKSTKLVKSASGEFELQTPRDRQGTFEPQMVTKRQIIITDELEAKVIRLYSMGLSYERIANDIEELYGFTLSPATLTNITDKVIPELNAWRSRELESQYAFVWFDAMFYKVREDGKVTTKALYNVIGYTIDGVKDLLGMYISETEGAHFWMNVLDDLKRRGVDDILIASVDNLKGFTDVIKNVFPKTEIQSCIIHQIRNTMRFIASKDMKAFLVDLRIVYRAIDITQAEANLKSLEDKWGNKYMSAIDSWKRNWNHLSTFFQYPEEVRTIMYTTNPIESFHRQVRSVTKTKAAFTNDIAFLKLVYLASIRACEKWSVARNNWGAVLNQLSIYFKDRIKPTKNKWI